MRKRINLIQNLLYNYVKGHLYITTSWITWFFWYSCCMHLFKSFYFLSIRIHLWGFFFWDNTHGLSFHFYLYSVKEENAFYLENFKKSFFVFYLLQFCHPIFINLSAIFMGLLFILAYIL
jgi:hypothetical protein